MQSQKLSSEWQIELMKQSRWLYAREIANTNTLERQHDYSYIIFPMAKAYEGFLKDYLLALGLISQETYNSRRFRIGRALNPDVASNQRDKWWLYDDIAHQCGDQVARQLWNTWLQCRNHVFHYFPGEKSTMTLEKVGQSLTMIEESIDLAKQCVL